MAKVEQIMMGEDKNYPAWTFECPGCGCNHYVTTEQPTGVEPVWEFNDDVEKPTFEPSIRVTSSHEGVETMCHSFVRNGTIEFLSDCTHHLAGQTVEMIDVE